MKIKVEEENKRLDIYLSSMLVMSRSSITKMIKTDKVLVNKKSVKAGYILKLGDIIEVDDIKDESKIKSENIKLDIYYEDEYLLVVNKPSHMVVHPGSGNHSHTLVNALMYHTKELSNIGGENRVGIVHRIDKDTSGLLLVAKTNKVHEILADDFKHKRIKRKYIALVDGIVEANIGKIDAPLGRDKSNRIKMCVTADNSKKSVTNFKVLERYKNATLLELILETGRTHQIRVHMAYIGHPVINDAVYGKKIINDYGQMLHAKYIGFTHPVTGKFLEFESPLEKEFEEILSTFKN